MTMARLTLEPMHIGHNANAFLCDFCDARFVLFFAPCARERSLSRDRRAVQAASRLLRSARNDGVVPSQRVGLQLFENAQNGNGQAL